MTELERQLTAALERLSAQYETEQRLHSERVEALRQQIERLSGQMTRLARDYRTLAGNVARALDLMRQRGRARDQGPSR